MIQKCMSLQDGASQGAPALSCPALMQARLPTPNPSTLVVVIYLSGMGTTRAVDVQGAPPHISPSILVYEDTSIQSHILPSMLACEDSSILVVVANWATRRTVRGRAPLHFRTLRSCR